MSQQLGLQLEPEKPPRRKRTGVLVSFHVRSHVAPQEALEGEQRAQTQEEAILAWMRAYEGRHTPYAVAEALALCVNSARRAMTNLTRRGLLVHWKGDRRPAGPWGQSSSTWSAA